MVPVLMALGSRTPGASLMHARPSAPSRCLHVHKGSAGAQVDGKEGSLLRAPTPHSWLCADSFPRQWHEPACNQLPAWAVCVFPYPVSVASGHFPEEQCVGCAASLLFSQ